MLKFFLSSMMMMFALSLSAIFYSYRAQEECVILEDNVIEQTIANDIKSVNSGFDEFEWVETRITFDKPFDNLRAFSYESVENVFQKAYEDEGALKTCVISVIHVGSNMTTDINEGIYLYDDMPIKRNDVMVDASSAFQLAKMSGRKSGSIFMTLRKPIYPIVKHPIYIIGNEVIGKITIDAYTGKVE